MQFFVPLWRAVRTVVTCNLCHCSFISCDNLRDLSGNDIGIYYAAFLCWFLLFVPVNFVCLIIFNIFLYICIMWDQIAVNWKSNQCINAKVTSKATKWKRKVSCNIVGSQRCSWCLLSGIRRCIAWRLVRAVWISVVVSFLRVEWPSKKYWVPPSEAAPNPTIAKILEKSSGQEIWTGKEM